MRETAQAGRVRAAGDDRDEAGGGAQLTCGEREERARGAGPHPEDGLRLLRDRREGRPRRGGRDGGLDALQGGAEGLGDVLGEARRGRGGRELQDLRRGAIRGMIGAGRRRWRARGVPPPAERSRAGREGGGKADLPNENVLALPQAVELDEGAEVDLVLVADFPEGLARSNLRGGGGRAGEGAGNFMVGVG